MARPSLLPAPSIIVPAGLMPTQDNHNKTPSHAGPIAGGVIGSIALVLLAVLLVIVWKTPRSRVEPPHIEAFRGQRTVTIYNHLTLVSQRANGRHTSPQLNNNEPSAGTIQDLREEIVHVRLMMQTFLGDRRGNAPPPSYRTG